MFEKKKEHPTITEYTFKLIKDVLTPIKISELTNIENVIKDLEGKAKISNQSELLKVAQLLKSQIPKQKELYEMGYNKIIPRSVLNDILKQYEKYSNDVIFLTSLESFPRLLPDRVYSRLKELNEKKLFDTYLVLFVDYTKESMMVKEKMAEIKRNKKTIENLGEEAKKEVTEEVKKSNRDPILFGSFATTVNINRNGNPLNSIKEIIASEFLYYIDSWDDEYCDLGTQLSVYKAHDILNIENVSQLLNPKEYLVIPELNDSSENGG